MKQLLRSKREAFVQLQQKKMNPEPRDRKELVSLQGFNPNFGAQPVCATWKDIEFECSLLPHARRWQQGGIKFEFNFFLILEPNRFKIQKSASPILKV